MAGPHDWALPTTTPVQNQVSPGHPSGAYSPNLNPPTTVDYTTPPVVDTSGGGWTPGAGRDESGYLPDHSEYIPPDEGISTINQVIETPPEPIEYFGELTNTGLGFEDQGQDYSTGIYRDPYTGKITKITPSSELNTHSKMLQLMEMAADPSGYDTASGKGFSAAEKQALADAYKGFTTQNLFGLQAGDDPAEGANQKKVIFTTPRVDEFGNELGGQPIMSSQGRALHDWIESQGEDYDPFEALHVAPEILRNQNIYGGTGGGDGWGWDDYYGDRRQAKMDLLNALAGGAPAKGLEQSGFFNELVPQYHPDEARAALESGIFSGMYGKPAQIGISGEGMKRMLRSYGSGLQAPRYANVAKGGIVGLLGV